MSFEINPLDFSLGFFALSTYRGLVVRQRTARELVKRFAERVAPVAQATRHLQESETLCRKGGTSRSDNAPHASGACAGAKLACGATFSATREFAWLAWVVNLLVVAVMITTREPLAPFVATPFISRDNYPTNVCYSP